VHLHLAANSSHSTNCSTNNDLSESRFRILFYTPTLMHPCFGVGKFQILADFRLNIRYVSKSWCEPASTHLLRSRVVAFGRHACESVNTGLQDTIS
jgi:hypothetical protein